MTESSLVLLVSENPATVAIIRVALESGREQFSLQHVERTRTAAARIAGGGVSFVLLDISGSVAESQTRNAFATLRAAAHEIPLIVLCEIEDEDLAGQMMQEGAAGYVLRPNCQRDLQGLLLTGIVRQQANSVRGERRDVKRGRIIAVVGAKGGVGATTVAVNVASTLASTWKVVLAELRPPFGTLCHFFRPHRATHTLEKLLASSQDEMDLGEVESCLWPNRNIPGLSVLFAPDETSSTPEIASAPMREILRRLSELCEVVVVDVAPSLSDADRAILTEADALALVVERDALSVDAAKAKLGALEAAGIVPQETGSVIVNRVPLAAPMGLADIESKLGVPTFGVIPPAADLCAAAYRVHIPVVKLDAESSLATSLVNLAKRLSPATGALRS